MYMHLMRPAYAGSSALSACRLSPWIMRLESVSCADSGVSGLVLEHLYEGGG